VPAKIKYVTANGQYQQPFSALLSVMDEWGRIISYRFFETKSPEEAKPLVQDLKKRYVALRATLEAWYSDQCCQDKSWLDLAWEEKKPVASFSVTLILIGTICV
jgi:hypothetical protein